MESNWRLLCGEIFPLDEVCSLCAWLTEPGLTEYLLTNIPALDPNFVLAYLLPVTEGYGTQIWIPKSGNGGHFPYGYSVLPD